MTFPGRIACIALFTAISASTPIMSANASAPNFPSAAVMKINGDGFRACKALGDSGYTATARGILGDGGGYHGASSRPFSIRTCFPTLSQCEHFIDRIDHRISQIDQLFHIRCKPRG